MEQESLENASASDTPTADTPTADTPTADMLVADMPTAAMSALDTPATGMTTDAGYDAPNAAEIGAPSPSEGLPSEGLPAEELAELGEEPFPDLLTDFPTMPVVQPPTQFPAAGPLMPWSPDLPAQPMRAAPRRFPATPRRWRSAALAAALTVLVLSALLVGVRGISLAFSRPPTLAATATATEQPIPTATPDPRIAHNAALGCVPNAPTPQPGIIEGGNYRDAAAPAPKEVALTFDDGPTPDSTPYILDILERTHTPATFFVEGQYVTQWPDLLRREWDDGFAIANHSWDHPLMAHLTPEQIDHQFGDTNKAIHDVLGSDACLWLYRPPYANYNSLVLEKAQQHGLTTITWDDGSNDWALPRPSPQTLANNVLTRLHPGAVVLFHDGPARHPNTERALPLVIQGILDRGYLPVTLPRLLADAHYPGITAEGPLPPPPTVPPDLLTGA